MRAHLPAIEPDRQVTDWGRSERVEGLMDKTVYDWLYHYWFRCEVEGIEHVPASGGALLVSNHSGALPPDAAMITKALKENTAAAAAASTVDALKGYPGFGDAGGQEDRRRARAPGQRAPPACTTRSSSCWSSRRGRKGTGEALQGPLPSCAASAAGGFVEAAMRAQVPIVPVAVVGAEEAMPIFAHMSALQRLTGLLYFPITPTFPHFGLAGFIGYLPAKFKIRFLEPVPTDQWGEEPWQDRGLIQTVADEIRGRVQEELIDMVAHRRSVWFG